MIIHRMEVILFVATILPCLCMGHSDTRVRLTTTHPVAEGGSLILSCSLTNDTSTHAAFYFKNRTAIGTVRRAGNSCQNGTTGQACYRRCSCTRDGSSFSMNISNVNRSWNKARVYCHTGHLSVASNTTEITVTYGPEVDLVFANTTENTTNFHLNCKASGEPDQYTYRWKHTFGSTVIRDTFDNVTSSGSVSTLTIPKVTYQDMGTYECKANNGNREGNDRGFLSVQGRPRAIEAQQRYVTEKDISRDINITFVSFPKPVNTTILRLDSALPPHSELSVNVSSVPVTMSFYNKNVSVDGYRVELHFSKFETKHQGRYMLYVLNTYTYHYNFDIAISDKPDSPTYLIIAQITDSSAIISWTPMDDNGNSQTFTVICRNSGGIQTNVTLNHSVSSYTIRNLDISTKYHVTLYASNVKGTSVHVTSSFKTKSENTTTGNAAIIGGAVGTVAGVILIIGLVAVLRRRRRHQPGPEATEEEPDDDNDGMKLNVLYESAGPNYLQQPGPSTGSQSGDVYAVVQKPPKSRANVTETHGNAEVHNYQGGVPELAMYAQVQKTEKGKVEKDAEDVKIPKQEVPESSVYSEVKKTRKAKLAKEGVAKEDIEVADATGRQNKGQHEDLS
ncbi:uncharacterized protein LOC110459568 isoform X2 [Mizuhopecten yessoensis]|uniref:uncharacterized protein LOC110459568 isoform X2 n=1 Tax=Mizuhopecten yessoensis TaxID=6573 RepID=UPI000B45C953|nr:uncharacterized protein LOC110459568 isoform X2 [Mizuhopecten yessoensis]